MKQQKIITVALLRIPLQRWFNQQTPEHIFTVGSHTFLLMTICIPYTMNKKN